MRINAESSVSIYLQVADKIRDEITSKKLKPGDMINSDRYYCEMLKVSHMTVKKAIDVLVSEGVIVRKKGVGSFIAEPKIVQSLFTLSGFTGDNEALGKKVDSVVLKFGVVAVPEKIAAALNVPSDGQVLELKRLRFADDEPVAMEDAFLKTTDQQRATLLKHDFSRESLYRVLQTECNIAFSHAEETIEVSGATSEMSENLEIAQGRPVFVINRTTFNENKEPLECVESTYRADRYIFSAILVNSVQ